MSALPGIGGSLFPRRYLVSGLERDFASPVPAESADSARRRLVAWWRRTEAECGPATGIRGLVDLVAMPLAAMLGFRTRGVRYERDRAVAHLETRAGAIVGLVVLPWAARPSGRWRDLTAAARAVGADWCVLIAPPFVSIVDARGQAVRRSVDFTLPDALDERSFRTFWALSHAAVFEARPSPTPPNGPHAATIDILVNRARRFQDRVRADLQHGVVRALDALTTVLPGRAGKDVAPFDEALTLVYRILFLLFAEARDLLPVQHPVYGRAYAVGTLSQEALAGGAATSGLWAALAAVTRLSRAGCRHEDLIVRPFNGRLFARRSAPSLEAGRHARASGRPGAARDAAVARALVSLATRPGPGGREEISYADLGVEQLGAVYERVLDLGPAAIGRSGHSLQRKQTGTFYTPQPLAEFVVRRTLAPLVTGASTDQILALRVVDPAMGSGAFLVAACRYLASAYERALVDEGRVSEADLTDDARAGVRRLIAEQCLAGVDRNPVAVQLARLSLWLTSLAGGKPLGFLDHRLRVGNSLVGASPDDLWRNEAMRRSGNGAMRQWGKGAMKSTGTLSLFDEAELEATLRQVVRPLGAMLTRPDDTVGDVRAKEQAWSRLMHTSSPLEPWRLACSLWCARWFWPAVDGGCDARPPSANEMRAAFDALVKRDRTLEPRRLESWLASARAAAAQVGFFHWPLEFADVFYEADGQPKARPGFDAVIGNPPWEMLRADPGGTKEPRPSAGSGRPEPVEGRNQLVRFLRESGLYPSCDRGHVNLYQPFLDRALSLARPGGRVGLILPWGLAADDGAATLRRKLFDETGVDTLVGLDNGAGLFPIHRGLRFLVLVAAPGRATGEVRMRCGVRTASEIDSLPDVDAAGDASAFPIRMSRAIVTAIGGPAMRIPDARRPDDLAWFERLARSHPALGAADGWSVSFGRELNASDDRPHFGRVGLPVVEGKHIAPFAVDTRAPTHRIRPEDAARRLPDRRFDRPRLAYRDVSGVANRVSLIAAVLPAGVVSTHTLFCLRTALPPAQQHYLCGLFNSYVLNAIVRMLMGGHVTTSLVEGLPVPRWRGTAGERRIARLAGGLARRPPAPGTDAALQAAVARLYDLDRDTFSRILEGFPLVPEQDRRLALEALVNSLE